MKNVRCRVLGHKWQDHWWGLVCHRCWEGDRAIGPDDPWSLSLEGVTVIQNRNERTTTMKITTAWAQQLDEQGRPPWLLSAYDEYTFDEWNGVPDFYTADVAKSSGPDVEVREIVIVVPDSAIRDAFKTPVAQAKVIS